MPFSAKNERVSGVSSITSCSRATAFCNFVRMYVLLLATRSAWKIYGSPSRRSTPLCASVAISSASSSCLFELMMRPPLVKLEVMYL